MALHLTFSSHRYEGVFQTYNEEDEAIRVVLDRSVSHSLYMHMLRNYTLFSHLWILYTLIHWHGLKCMLGEVTFISSRFSG